MDYILAFVIGGIICVLSQILMDTTQLSLPGRNLRGGWHLRAFYKFCRSRGICTIDRIRLQSVERNQGCS